jgi:dinuclear metal center YbgI/SA1388 family protein
MSKIKDVVTFLEQWAPPGLQESYDNSGLLTGDPETEITGVLISLDCTEEVVKEAVEKGCNLIISHHPIIFRGLKSLTGKNYVERTVIKAIRETIGIYAIHTNLDHVIHGVNAKIAEKLELQDARILVPKSDQLKKLVCFVPKKDTNKVLKALYDAGAGSIGNYSHCSFRTKGTGTFKPNESANPHIGTHGETEEVNENRIELIFPSHVEFTLINTMKKVHPYEEVAYYVSRLDNENQEIGAGMIGSLSEAVRPEEFLQYVKDKMNTGTIRYTTGFQGPITRVALCGGAGSFLLSKAIQAGAHAFITGDFKYHEFFDAEDRIMIADIGHYESEVYTKDLIYEVLSEKFTNFALRLSKVVTNPVSYF